MVVQSGRDAIVFPSRIAPSEPTAGVATSAANATGVDKKKVIAKKQ
jgi:hypothetical protein